MESQPWSDRLPWEPLGSMWVTNLTRSLNKSLPKDEFRAYAHVHLGHMVEADVAEYERESVGNDGPTGDGASPQNATLPPPPVLTFDPTFPDEFEVRILTIRDGRQLAAVIEFVSPANKDRKEHRRKFLSKCVGYLQLGIGLVIVDTVTYRHENFHNDLIREIGGKRIEKMADVATYIASYRPCRDRTVATIDVWPYPAAVGQPIPSVPLPLRNGPDHMLELEATYMQALDDYNF